MLPIELERALAMYRNVGAYIVIAAAFVLVSHAFA